MSINVIGCGSYLPKKIVTNSELEQSLNLESGWIVKRTGIEERRLLDTESFIDSCAISATKAIEHARINAQDVQLLVLATTTPQQIMPSTANLVQSRLGIKECMSFDMQAACTGFIYALVTAESLMRANNLKYALVMGCDAFSRIIDMSDPITGVLFGDGFGAVVLKNDECSSAKGIFYTHCGTDVSGVDELQVPWGIARGFHALEQSSPYVVMNGKEIFKSAVNRFSDEIALAMRHENLLISDIGCIITHQANIRIIKAVCQNLKIPLDKCEISLVKHGNTSAASIPLALCNLLERRNVPQGEIIILTGFGAGYTWGTVLFDAQFV